jgi:hypothetical protein
MINIEWYLQVETIGDAYMVVGGLPEVTPRHASFVANMALDMIVKANEVHSPATGKPLQVMRCPYYSTNILFPSTLS